MNKRQVINFNEEWLYLPKDCTDAKSKDFDDTEFQSVTVPHANTILSRHKGSCEKSFLEDIEEYRFISTYRKHFTLDETLKGQIVRINFEAVATVCEVYVNGEYVGEHKGAYTGFTFDITSHIKFGEDNVIYVRVDSKKHTDVPPEGYQVDYCLFGGIVRNVNLILTDKAYIEDVYLTSEITESKAILKTQVKLSEGDSFKVEVIDKNGERVACGGEEAIVFSPHLWSIDDPYLYTVKVITATDEYAVKFGFRRFEFKDSGLCLNGETIKIMGINRHEQWPWIGRAVPDKLQRRDADMIKETGFNAVRCSHYPQAISFLDRCDEIGLIVFEEAPGWQHIGDDSWREIYKENIREMIYRDRNHPSIFSWGVRVNESNDCDELYEETNKLSRALDPTRPTHGTRRQDSYEGSNFLEDIYTAHYIYPETPIHKPFIVTEHSWDCWMNGYGKGSVSDEKALAYTKDFADKVNYYFGNDNCAGGFAWSMFDYDNEVNYTKSDNVFYSGIYDIFRLPKMVANLYISQKDAEKHGANIYIANYWDDDEKPLRVNSVSGDVAQGAQAGGGDATYADSFSVTVMSNCDSVQLYINGKKVEKAPLRQFTNLPHPFFVFEDIEYEEGEITAIGYINGKEVVRQMRKTPEKEAELIVKPDYDTIVADGCDMTQVTVSITDKNGTLLERSEKQVEISVVGAGRFIGEEKIKLENGRCIFIVQSNYKETGEIFCKVKAEGVKEGVCTIKVI